MWIAKRPVKIQRDDKLITVPPGSPVPEAASFRAPTMWCVWSEPRVAAPTTDSPSAASSSEENTSDETPSSEEPVEDGALNYNTMPVKQLRKLAKAAQKKTGDDATDIQKADKAELIVIIKSVQE